MGRPADDRLGWVRARDSPFTTAFVLGNPTVVILLQKTQPLFAIALAHVLLRERLRWAYWPCFAVAVLGAYLISFDGFVEPFEALGSVQALPALLTLGAAILWGSSTALGRFVLKDMPFHTLTGARLLLARPRPLGYRARAGLARGDGAAGSRPSRRGSSCSPSCPGYSPCSSTTGASPAPRLRTPRSRRSPSPPRPLS